MMKSRKRANKHPKSRDEISLLANRSPPPSPAAFGVFSVRSTTNNNNDMSAYADVESTVSFETALSQLPPQNRFQPQHDPKEVTRQVQRASGALQFVPAYEESTTTLVGKPAVKNEEQHPPSTVITSANDNHSATWDAIIEADDSSSDFRSRGRSWNKQRSKRKSKSDDHSLSSADSSKSSRFRRSRSSQSLSKRATQSSSPINSSPQSLFLPTEEDAAAASTVSISRPRGKRIARLASIFASRASINQKDENTSPPRDKPFTPQRTQQRPRKLPPAKESSVETPVKRSSVPPPSPSRSSVSGSSSGYVGWPGTQDKRGEIVAMHSSYDDSSVSAAAFNQRKHLDDSDAEMRKWMDSSFDEESSVGTGTSRKMTLLEKRMDQPEKFQPPEKDASEDEESEDEENPADFHLAALVAKTAGASPMAKVTESSPKRNGPRNGTNDRYASLEEQDRPGYRSRANSSTPMSTAGTSRAGTSSVAATSASGAISIQNLFGKDATNRALSAVSEPAYKGDPWDVDSSPHPPSSSGTSVSKDSSAYFSTRDPKGMGLPALDTDRAKAAFRSNSRSASSIMRPKPGAPQPPTEAALEANNRLTSAPPSVNARNVRGFRGFYDKTADMPNLIDNVDSDSVSSRGTSTLSYQYPYLPNRTTGAAPHRIDEDSDVFDDVSDVFDGLSSSAMEQQQGKSYLDTQTKEESSNGDEEEEREGSYEKLKDTSGEGVADLNLVLLGGGLTTIVTTPDDYDKRKTSSEFDENLTNSEVDQFGFARLPEFNEMAVAGRKPQDTAALVSPPAEAGRLTIQDQLQLPNGISAKLPTNGRTKGTPRSMFDSSLTVESESGSSYVSEQPRQRVGDLTEYVVSHKLTRKMIKRYRELCPPETSYLTKEQFENEEDAKKAFALQEMRSRIMEKDIERGLERRGGTVVVDDIVTTPYYQTSQRVRDAVIVSKAWRDGASPKDVITASNLTRRAERTYYVKRPLRYRRSPGRSPGSQANDSMSSAGELQWISYSLEPVRWTDDTDFIQLRCPSLGPRCMRGSEMFTIGDCQSILLKLTNERCLNLRWELNEATARQIEAEEIMKAEGDAEDGMMTEAEMKFLTSMEEVKTISKRLVVAEKAFTLVKDRIEKLVAKYEVLLVKIESESVVASSIVTYESSYYSDESSHYSSEEDREKEQLARRAQRAELRAELAAREALLAKQEAQKIRYEKERELEALQQKLNELQSESSYAIAEREHSVVLAKAITSTGEPRLPHDQVQPKIDQAKVESVKQKFRDRMAARMRASPSNPRTLSSASGPNLTRPYSPSPESRPIVTPPSERPPLARRNRYGITGEEMFQHLDFYERSLKAVEDTRTILSQFEKYNSSKD